MYRDSDIDEDCASSRREWRNERATMAGPPDGPTLCEAGAPIEQASGDGENLMAGPPVEPPSHPDDEEPGARGPAQPGDGPLHNRRRSPPSPCPFPNCAERTHKLRDIVTLCHLHPVFRRSVPLGDEATSMRLRVCEWLADQLIGSWATLTDLVQCAHFSGLPETRCGCTRRLAGCHGQPVPFRAGESATHLPPVGYTSSCHAVALEGAGTPCLPVEPGVTQGLLGTLCTVMGCVI